MDQILKELAAAVGQHPALTWLGDESHTIGGLGREDYFACEPRFDALSGVRSAVRLEPGIQSGSFPTEIVPITSLVGRYLHKQDIPQSPETSPAGAAEIPVAALAKSHLWVSYLGTHPCTLERRSLGGRWIHRIVTVPRRSTSP
jgi:hypothetical protein